jgi:hypothetical protein
MPGIPKVDIATAKAMSVIIEISKVLLGLELPKIDRVPLPQIWLAYRKA